MRLTTSQFTRLIHCSTQPSSVDTGQTDLVKDLIQSNQEYFRKYEELKHSIGAVSSVSPFVQLNAGSPKELQHDHDIEYETELDNLQHFISLFVRLQQEVETPSYAIGSKSRSRIAKHISEAQSSETRHLHRIHGEAVMRDVWEKMGGITASRVFATDQAGKSHDQDDGASKSTTSTRQTIPCSQEDNLKSSLKERYPWEYSHSRNDIKAGNIKKRHSPCSATGDETLDRDEIKGEVSKVASPLPSANGKALDLPTMYFVPASLQPYLEAEHSEDEHSAISPLYKCHFKPCSYKSKRESSCNQHMKIAHGWGYVRSKTGKARNKGSQYIPQTKSPSADNCCSSDSEFPVASPFANRGGISHSVNAPNAAFDSYLLDDRPESPDRKVTKPPTRELNAMLRVEQEENAWQPPNYVRSGSEEESHTTPVEGTSPDTSTPRHMQSRPRSDVAAEMNLPFLGYTYARFEFSNDDQFEPTNRKLSVGSVQQGYQDNNELPFGEDKEASKTAPRYDVSTRRSPDHPADTLTVPP